MIDLEKALLTPPDTQPVDTILKLWADYPDGRRQRLCTASDMTVIKGTLNQIIDGWVMGDVAAANHHRIEVSAAVGDVMLMAGNDLRVTLHCDGFTDRGKSPGDIRIKRPKLKK